MLGQWTTIYAAPNTGKTLLTLWLLKENLLSNNLDGDFVFYVNADDNFKGIVEKTELAEQWGFHIIAPNQKGFSTSQITELMVDLAETGEARGVIIILDTLKKFTDLMHKRDASEFGIISRSFISAGGTLICLAHTNKHKNAEGKSIYSGTSDIRDDSDCAFIIDKVEGGLFQDDIAPDIPVLDFVTIDTLTGAVTISWNQNGQDDTFGYVIYVENASGAIIELDNVFGISTTSYTYNPDITSGPLTYSVAAFDSCWATSVPPTYQTSAKGDIHTTSFLSSSLDICSRQIQLSWTPYIGWTGTNVYTILGYYGASGWIEFGNTTNTNFIIDVFPGETYTFVIQSNSEIGQESFSNLQKTFVTSAGQPSFNYLQVATVSNEEVDLKLYIDASANILEISFQRLESAVFVELGRVPVTVNQLTFIDKDVSVNDYFYTYRAQVVDSCGQLRDTTNEAQTILLSITNDENSKINYLTWTGYHEYEGAILGYDIYRGYDDIFNTGPIASVAIDSRHFVDDVNDFVTKGKICYYIEAIEAMNTYNFSEVSRSNEACVTLPPLIFIPNAFTPEGLNTIFRPILNDFDPTDYDFTIFDSWGQVLYRTNDPEEGWNGKISLSNEMANSGTYLYMLTLKDGDGIEIIKRGHVTLLK